MQRMARRRFSARLGIGRWGSLGVAFAAFLTATPHAGGQIQVKQIQIGQIKAPSIAAPRVPVVGVPGAPTNPPPSQAGVRRLTIQRVEAFVSAARLGLNYLPGEVLVKFKPGMGSGDQNRALLALPSRPASDTIEWHGEVAVVRDAVQPNAYILADQLNGQPEVEYAEPNFIAKINPLVKAFAANVTTATNSSQVRPSRGGFRAAGVPSDPDYMAYQWNFSLLSMPSAWDLQPGSHSGIVVAVIDTGLTGAETSLTQITYPLWTGSRFETLLLPFVANPDLPASRHFWASDFAALGPWAPHVVDMDGHGTHVAGTIGEATNNGMLLAGMAYNVRIMPVKVCVGYWEVMISRAQAGIPGFAPADVGGCAYSDIADGVRWAADSQAKVMNISIGGTGSSTTLRDALAYAAGKGSFISIAMGNEFEAGNPVIYPAAYAAGIDGVMSVASIGPTKEKAYYSSTGSHCEIAAPGGDVRAGAGRLDGGAIWQSTLRSSDVSASLAIPRFDRYDRAGYQGTSMASPHVAGMAALLWAQIPALTPIQIEQIIRLSARDLGAVGRDDSYGYGLIQPRAALFGRGLLR